MSGFLKLSSLSASYFGTSQVLIIHAQLCIPMRQVGEVIVDHEIALGSESLKTDGERLG